LAELLGAGGYATCGFVANNAYCASDSGLGRGFTCYQDFIFPELTVFKTAVLVNRIAASISKIDEFFQGGLEMARLQPYTGRVLRALGDDRKEAAVVNREILDWLSRREQPERPFFAFVNYFDAHYAYQLPKGRLHRFGAEPTESGQRDLIRQWATRSRAGPSSLEVAFVMAAYDDCIAELDQQLGKLIDELDRRGVLKDTWLIITSDHGESFGEHAGIFGHGMSLYQTELHVPLLIVPPGGRATKKVVRHVVSLQDLAATIVELSGIKDTVPFPGESLARFWNDTSLYPRGDSGFALAELALPPVGGSRDWSLLPRKDWPQVALRDGSWSYVRHEGEQREELFHLSEDVLEQRNRAGDPAARATVDRMRTAVDRITGGPLLPTRFEP
jgi:arylsulfatase A-like enzyme